MNHDELMRRALHLASQCSPLTAPNPRVGCVIVKDGQIMGEGFTQPVGGSHAEIVALNDAKNKGPDVRGATVYVTLEPCCHFGRTPPCVDALIQAGIAKVVASMADPNPRVAGQGFIRLKEAGIDVVNDVLGDEAREMNLGFLSRIERGRPWVRMKVAASLDGKTALLNGKSQWITSQAARDDGHVWRARANAILTGIGTVQSDNPQLTVRAIEVPKQPQRIVLDSHLIIDPAASILDGGGTWIFTTVSDEFDKMKRLRDKGAEIIVLPSENRRVHLQALMQELGRREINEVHVESGEILNGALIRAGCVDELLLYMAPSLLGEGRGMFGLGTITHLKEKTALKFHEVVQIGPDLRIRARFM